MGDAEADLLLLKWLGKRMLGVGRSIAGVESFGLAPQSFLR
jgi:hypothetical protein